MNGENDKLIRDFMNAFEKKDVKVLEDFFHSSRRYKCAQRNAVSEA